MTHLRSIAPIARTVDALSFPGVTEESRETVKQLIEENNRKHHIFFNEQKFHNHVVHHLLDAYSLGSSPERLRSIYEEHASYQRPIPPRSVHITTENWKSHFSKSELWPDYFDFFNAEVNTHGVRETLDKYFFDPDLFGRIMSGVYHPLIHIAFGVEFRLPIIVAEGLAMAALEPDQVGQFFSYHPSPAPSIPLLELITEISNDKRFESAVSFEDDDKMAALMQNAPDLVKEYLSQWNVQDTEKDVEEKQRELYECCVLLYAAVTRPGKSPMFHFFLAHALTSSLSIHVLLHHFTLKQQAILLKAHFDETLIVYISAGRPKLYVDHLKEYKTKLPGPNPWVETIQFAITTPDVHAMKIVRALLQAEALYGQYEGIFLKAAEITADAFAKAPQYLFSGGRMDQHSAWDHSGIGWDQAWDTVGKAST